jgi:heterodisulfide reductase subunit A
MVEGIFICGACQGPMAIPETVAQGAGAAARVGGMIGQGTVVMEPIKAHIDADHCSGCRICNNLCPYTAIVYHEDKKVSEVITALCQGCGTCVAACPSAAIAGAHFTRSQLMAQVKGMLWDVQEALETSV